MYASHRDACILAYYASVLSFALEEHYTLAGLQDSVIAYRSLGKANYDFAAEVLEFCIERSPVTILAFDVKGFFDNLEHSLLKTSLKNILNCSELDDDWYKVYRHVTKFCYVDKQELKTHAVFQERLRAKGKGPIASIRELKANGVTFHKNPTPGMGIPQGTPISAVFSNSYMLEFDKTAKYYCDSIGALYRRYSDDILIVCKPDHADHVNDKIEKLIASVMLELSSEKTERSEFDHSVDQNSANRMAQYLGYYLFPHGATIRASSLSRQWRKMRRAIKRTRKVAEDGITAGYANKVWTKKLRRRFTPLRSRNFSSYGRRSAKAFGSNQKIIKQIHKLERKAELELDKLKELSPQTIKQTNSLTRS